MAEKGSDTAAEKRGAAEAESEVVGRPESAKLGGNINYGESRHQETVSRPLT